MKRLQNGFLVILLLMTSLGAFAQERYPIRLYRIGEQVFTADSAGSAVFSYPASDVQIRANGTLIQLTIGKNTRYYAPTKVLDQSGSPWGSTVGASMLAYQNTTIATSGSSGSGGTITTNAGALTQGTLAPERLPPAAVQTDAAQTIKNKTIVAPVIQSPTGLTKTDVGLSNVPNLNPSQIVRDSLNAVPPLSTSEFGLDGSGNIVPRPLFSRMQGLPNSIGAYGVTDVPTRTQTSQMISDSAGTITFSGNGKTLTKTGTKSWNVDIPGGTSDVNKTYVDDKDNQLQGLITGNGNSLTALQAQVTTLQGQLTTANGTITTLNSTIQGQNSTIASLSSTVTSIQNAYASGSGIYVISTPPLTVSNVGATTATLSWPASTSANSYTVQQATNAGFTTGLLTIATGNITTYNVTALTPGTPYFWRVMASGGANTSPSGWGTTSATTALGTQLATPTLIVGPGTTSTYTFSWSAVPNATSYTLRQSAAPGMTSPVSFVTSGTSYTVTGQTPGLQSYFDLSASANGFITSANSATVTATTSNTVNGSVSAFADWNTSANSQNVASVINGNTLTHSGTTTGTSYVVGNQKIVGMGTAIIRMSVQNGVASGDLAFGTGANTAWSSGTGFTLSVSHAANNKIFVRSGTSYLAQPIVATAVAVQIVADGVNLKAQYTNDGTTWLDIPGGTVAQVADLRIKAVVAYDATANSHSDLVNVQSNGLTAP